MAQHRFSARVKWTGNIGSGTSAYTAYSRDHEISGEGKVAVSGSSAPAFRGDASRYNPEELLIASLSACHMLWALHLCSEAGIIVDDYEDDAVGELTTKGVEGQFSSVTLRPRLKVRSAAEPAVMESIHKRAHDLCFIAKSVNFPVHCEASVEAAG
jgi:organic hydroperoxide reductase OsmC/OhrA